MGPPHEGLRSIHPREHIDENRPLIIALCACTASAHAQYVALYEPFEYSVHGQFPPPGWSEVNVNGGPNAGWEDSTVQPLSGNVLAPTDIAGHDDYSPGATNDFRLITSPMDVSAFPTVHLGFASSLAFPTHMANHPSSVGDGVSTVEVSIDGGATWMVEWTDTSTAAGLSFLDINLDVYAGNPDLRIAFHYYGTWAHAWGIDDVFVADYHTPTSPEIVRIGQSGQPGSGVMGARMTPYGMVGVGWSRTVGPTALGGPTCNGTIHQLVNPQIEAILQLNAYGAFALQPLGGIPAGASGQVYVQAIDLTTCVPTNVILL